MMRVFYLDQDLNLIINTDVAQLQTYTLYVRAVPNFNGGSWTHVDFKIIATVNNEETINYPTKVELDI